MWCANFFSPHRTAPDLRSAPHRAPADRLTKYPRWAFDNGTQYHHARLAFQLYFAQHSLLNYNQTLREYCKKKSNDANGFGRRLHRHPGRKSKGVHPSAYSRLLNRGVGKNFKTPNLHLSLQSFCQNFGHKKNINSSRKIRWHVIRWDWYIM